jgi:hypothetical protein
MKPGDLREHPHQKDTAPFFKVQGSGMHEQKGCAKNKK